MLVVRVSRCGNPVTVPGARLSTCGDSSGNLVGFGHGQGIILPSGRIMPVYLAAFLGRR